MTSAPRISVVIPVYNRAHTIAGALESVLRQTRDAHEILVVDDGSTDHTAEIVDSYSPRVRRLTQTNQGPGKARNAGVENATGDYVAFLDSDDRWYPWTLQLFTDIIVAERPTLISGTHVDWHGGALPDAPHHATTYTQHSDFLAAAREGLWIAGCAVCLLRKTFISAGGFPTENINAEDSDLWLKLGLASPFVEIRTPPTMAYRRTPSSLISDTTKTAIGVLRILESEAAGVYPGGLARRADRHAVISAHLRPACLACARSGEFQLALQLYCRSIPLNVRLKRIRFLLAAPPLMLLGKLRNLAKRKSPMTTQ